MPVIDSFYFVFCIGKVENYFQRQLRLPQIIVHAIFGQAKEAEDAETKLFFINPVFSTLISCKLALPVWNCMLISNQD